MPTGTIAPWVKQQWLTDNGAVAAGYYMFTYEAGTTTKLSTYSDSALTTANANPTILDSAGRANFYLDAKSYKFTLAAVATDPPVATIWTVDNVSATPAFNVALDILGTAGETLAANDLVYLSDGSGSRTAGRWYKTDADNDYSSTTANAIGLAVTAIASAAEGTIRTDGRMTGFAGLSAGTVYYISATAGALTSSAPTNARPVGVADSATTFVLSQYTNPELYLPPPIRDASATVDGIVSTGAQTLAGIKTFAAHPLFEPGTSAGTTAPVSGVIYTDVTARTGTGTDETDASTFTLPANTLDTNGKALRFTAIFKTASGASLRTYKLYWNGASIITGTTTTASGQTYISSVIIRTGAATQVARSDLWIYATAGLNTATVAEATNHYGTTWDGTSPTNATLSSTVAIKTTLQDNAAGTNITQLAFIVEIIG